MALRNVRNQAANRTFDARNVRTARTDHVILVFPVRPPSAPTVRSRVDVVNVPRDGSDRGTDTQSAVLAADEDFEVVVYNGFRQVWELCVAARVKQERVPAESIGLAGDGGLGAMERACELSMTGARGEA